MFGSLRARMPLPLVVVASALAAGPEPPSEAEADFGAQVVPVVSAYCIDCHESEEPAGELDLTRFRSAADAFAEPLVWESVGRRLASGEMPPKAATLRPSAEERESVIAWIASHFDVEVHASPRGAVARGRTTARRLTRYEYRHAVLDLFGVDFAAEERLPADGVGHGFDVLGDVHSMSPLRFEKLFEAAEEIAAEALPVVARYREQVRGAGELELQGGANYLEHEDLIGMYSVATATGHFDVPRSGDYLLRLRAFAQQAGPDPARASVAVDGHEVERVDVTATSAADHDLSVRLDAGPRRISARFVNDYYMPDDPDPQQRDRNLVVEELRLLGPTDAPLRTAFEARFVLPGELDAPTQTGATGTTGVRGIVGRLARSSWRGPVTAEQETELMELSPPDASAQDRLRTALTAVLVSPRFLYRLEPDGREASRALRGDELAARLAAFLWSSVPDERLLAEAATGALDSAEGLAVVVERMLLDARSSRLAVAFAGQWLQLGRLDTASPDPRRFPEWSVALRDSMRRESEAFFDAVLRERRPIAELLSADFTFVDERLAKHYGIVGVRGDAMQRVAVPAHLRGTRGGILGQAAPLVATSMPTRTSPVVRGKWVLEALLATPPLPPPPAVESIDARVRDGQARSVREQLELHRSKPACAACHEPMDGLGFALESSGPTGAWRESEDGKPIDTGAVLPGGVTFEGPAGLREELLREDKFLRGFARHLVTYALGRGLTPVDSEALDALLGTLPADASLYELVQAVAQDDLFRRHRRAAPD